MTLYQKEKMVFVELKGHQMLCIGPVEEVEKENDNQICDRINLAVAINRFNALEVFKYRVH